MKRALAAIFFLASTAAFAQVCDVTYSYETQTMDGTDVSEGSATMRAVPMDQVNFNHDRQMSVLNALSKEQDKCKADGTNSCYQVDVYEDRACDGGAKTRQAIGAGSASIQGMTYAGSIRVADVMVAEAKKVNDFHRARAAQGKKSGWDHGKAKKVQRDDVGKKKQPA